MLRTKRIAGRPPASPGGSAARARRSAIEMARSAIDLVRRRMNPIRRLAYDGTEYGDRQTHGGAVARRSAGAAVGQPSTFCGSLPPRGSGAAHRSTLAEGRAFLERACKKNRLGEANRRSRNDKTLPELTAYPMPARSGPLVSGQCRDPVQAAAQRDVVEFHLDHVIFGTPVDVTLRMARDLLPARFSPTGGAGEAAGLT